MEAIERLAQVLHMVGALKTLHKHVVNVYLHGVFDQLLEDLVDHSLKSSSGVFQSEWHHLITVDSSIGDERHLIFV